jgi:hypothetical protein
VKRPNRRLDLAPIVIEKGKKMRRGGLDGPRYVEQIMKGPLMEFCEMQEAQIGQPVEVVEDGAPSHHSKFAASAQKQLGISPHIHPLSSPNLNPIELLWLIVKNQVANIPGSSNMLDKLWECCILLRTQLEQLGLDTLTDYLAVPWKAYGPAGVHKMQRVLETERDVTTR